MLMQVVHLWYKLLQETDKLETTQGNQLCRKVQKDYFVFTLNYSEYFYAFQALMSYFMAVHGRYLLQGNLFRMFS